MLKKLLIVIFTAAMLASCGEQPVATLDSEEGVENTITERVIVEEVTE